MAPEANFECGLIQLNTIRITRINEKNKISYWIQVTPHKYPHFKIKISRLNTYYLNESFKFNSCSQMNYRLLQT